MKLTIGIAGLGLIGGSLARAYKRSPDCMVYGCDTDAETQEFAQLSGVVDGPLDGDTVGRCDCVLLAVTPAAATDFLRRNAPLIRRDAVVIDCCGVKRQVCGEGFAIAREYGFTFVGGHPMAGTHSSGFKHSRADLFEGAPMVLVPPFYDDMELLGRVRELLEPVGFGLYSVTTAESHDSIIAFTSQLAHVVSNAYVKSPSAGVHKGFSAGSYRDLTRVARLNPDMWTELFISNSDMLTGELDTLIAELKRYREAIRSGDADTLRGLLSEGSRRKEEVDGE